MISKSLTTASDEKGKTNDCSVIAIATLARIPYEEAHTLLESLGRKRRKGLSTAIILKATKKLGLKLERRMLDNVIQEYPKQYRDVLNVTPRQVDMFPAAWQGDHIVFIHKHGVHDH